jgi:UDP-4-amino-4,6-dideoxy-N-acetyl-beta-L-altrosamine transaminase
MISYGRQTIDESDIKAVLTVLKSDWLTQGPSIEKFESELKTYFGFEHCCVTSNGTAALHLSGLALGWKSEDIVITSPITFLASANCIVYAGATPDFVDIDPVTYTIDPNKLEEKIQAYHLNGKRVKAVIGVDYAGHPCDWKALRNIADRYKLQLVNDNCHALGASYCGSKQYAASYADVVTQSYHPVKHITTGEGGAILTNDSKLDAKVRMLRSHGMTKDSSKLGKNEGNWYYEMHEVGYNYRITDLQCELGRTQLSKLDHFVSKRRNIANNYHHSFIGNHSIILPKIAPNVEHAYHLYPLQINFKEIGLDKRKFFTDAKKCGIDFQVHYIPIHLQPYYQKKYGFKLGDFPNSESFYLNETSIPIYPVLSLENQQKVVDTITKLINR